MEDIEILKMCFITLKKKAFRIEEMQTVMIQKCGIKSLRYGHVAPYYMKQTIKGMEMDNLIGFDKVNGIIILNFENSKVIEMLESIKNENKTEA